MNNKKHTSFFLSLMILCLIVASCSKDNKEINDNSDDHLLLEELEIEVHKIWDEASYNMSADFIRFNGMFYCAFREASEEMGPGGKVRVINSVDGETWETVQVLEFTDLPPSAEYPDHLTFNGVNQYMKIPHHPDFDFTSDDVFSLSAWVYREVGSSAGALVSTRSANNQNAFDFDAQSNTLILDFGNPHLRRHNKTGTSQFVFGEWHHVGFTYDGPNNKIWMYFNGENIELNTGQTNDLQGTEWNNYGNDITVFAKATLKTAVSQVPTARFSKGKIRSLRFWSKAMTEEEMTADMTATVDASTPDLIAGYDFGLNNLEEQGDSWIVPDIKGNHHGILSNFILEKPSTNLQTDLQMPKLSIAPGNRLMLLMSGGYDNEDGSFGSRSLYVSFSDDGKSFSRMVRSKMYATENELSDEDFRVSGVTWDQTTLNAYGFDYMSPLTLFKTTNGTTFQVQKTLTDLAASPSEVQVQFDKSNKLYAVMRKDDGDQKGILAVSAPPYNHFDYHDLDFPLHTPNFILMDDNTLLTGGRGTSNTNEVYIIVTDLVGNVLKEVPVPITEGAGYPDGIAVAAHGKYLWLSYSSLHSGKSDIYMAKIPLDDLKQ